MKCLLLADDRLDLLTTLETILKHWGYRVLTATGTDQTRAFLAESSPVMLIVGRQLLGPDLNLPYPPLPLLVLEHPEKTGQSPEADMTLEVPVDIFALFSFIQSRVERHPRQNLRLRLHLPGMYCARGEEFVLAEVLSLSMAGLFFRSPLRVAKGTRLSVVFPLLGHGKELEVEGNVLYVIDPSPQNNYTQGFGLQFATLDQEQAALLKRFMAEHFFSEIAACQPGIGAISTDQLRR
jgi:Tfp pilus assembly protein PilZ